MKKILFLLCILSVFLIMSSCTDKVESFTFEKEEIRVYSNQEYVVNYIIVPSNTDSSKIKWETSNPQVAIVENGIIKGVSKGECIVIGTIDGVNSKCNVVVLDETVFEDLMPEDMLKLPFYELSSDGKQLKLDSNPYNSGSLMGTTAERDYSIISTLNQKLNLSNTLTESMAHTRAADGMKVEIMGDLEVRWSYHPNTGIEATYTKIDMY